MSEPTALFAPLKPRQAASRLWSAGRFVADSWRMLSDAEPVPSSGHVILSLDRWRAERDVLIAVEAPLALALPAQTNIDVVADDLARLDLITLSFPKFSDGRAYSTARRLREAGFTGELRAIGDVLLDQMPLMLRSGFDTFEITSAATIEALEARPVPAVSRVYQAGQESPPAQWRSRRNAKRTDRELPSNAPRLPPRAEAAIDQRRVRPRMSPAAYSSAQASPKAGHTQPRMLNKGLFPSPSLRCATASRLIQIMGRATIAELTIARWDIVNRLCSAPTRLIEWLLVAQHGKVSSLRAIPIYSP